MGVMYAMRCDMCGDLQVKEEAHQIRGRTYQSNGKTMFSCAPCDGKLTTALALGNKGLDDPLKAAAGLLGRKDAQIRNLELAQAAKAGDFMGAADELRAKRERGGTVPVIGLDFETQYNETRRLTTQRVHHLPAPKPVSDAGTRKSRKKKK